jgi:hypothetical protein
VNYLLEIVIFLASFLVFWASLCCFVPWYANENTIELLVDTSLLVTWPKNRLWYYILGLKLHGSFSSCDFVRTCPIGIVQII